MKLMYKEQILGCINHVYKEAYWIHGFFEKTDEFEKYEGLFKDLVCEDGFDESKYEIDILDDNNWYVTDNGKKIGICIPAIYDDGDISFRYR